MEVEAVEDAPAVASRPLDPGGRPGSMPRDSLPAGTGEASERSPVPAVDYLNENWYQF